MGQGKKNFDDDARDPEEGRREKNFTSREK